MNGEHTKCWLVLDCWGWRPHIPAVMDEQGEVTVSDHLGDLVLRVLGWRWFGEVCMTEH